jgi:hypothetical protein
LGYRFGSCFGLSCRFPARPLLPEEKMGLDREEEFFKATI